MENRKKEVMDFLQYHAGFLSAREIANTLDIPIKLVANYLRAAVNSGEVVIDNNDIPTLYCWVRKEQAEQAEPAEPAPGPWQDATEAVVADEQAAAKLAGLDAAIIAIGEEIDRYLMLRRDPVLDALHVTYESAIRAKTLLAEAAAAS